MSRSHQKVCDQCNKNSGDGVSPKGWINIQTSGDLKFSYSNGKEYNNKAKFNDIDFCSLTCFEQWLKY